MVRRARKAVVVGRCMVMRFFEVFFGVNFFGGLEGGS